MAHGDVHPLTCENDASHKPLEPVKQGRRVVMKCPDCDYVQTEIPNVVIEAGSRMAAGPSRGPKPKIDILVPPISDSFEDAVTKLLKVKPPKKKQ